MISSRCEARGHSQERAPPTDVNKQRERGEREREDNITGRPTGEDRRTLTVSLKPDADSAAHYGRCCKKVKEFTMKKNSKIASTNCKGHLELK